MHRNENSLRRMAFSIFFILSIRKAGKVDPSSSEAMVRTRKFQHWRLEMLCTFCARLVLLESAHSKDSSSATTPSPRWGSFTAKMKQSLR